MEKSVLKPMLEVDSELTEAANEDTLETLEANWRTDLRTAELMSALVRLEGVVCSSERKKILSIKIDLFAKSDKLYVVHAHRSIRTQRERKGERKREKERERERKGERGRDKDW